MKIVGDLLSPLSGKSDPPIYLVGVARSGTTWIGSILSTAMGVKYFVEPFNPIKMPEARPYFNRYLRGGDRDEDFARYCGKAFAGNLNQPHVNQALGGIYRKLPWWPARVLVKDVHCFLSLEWIHHNITPNIVIVLRHPCGVADSRFRLWGEHQLSWNEKIMAQPGVMNDYLQPFESTIDKAQGFWQRIGMFWGAFYYIMLEQQRRHPEWIVIQHEELCRDPIGQYRQLFEQLNIKWTAKTDYFLKASTTRNSKKAFIPKRISEKEPDKWKNNLNPQQIEQIMEFVRPFNIPYYLES